jgi:ketosteroid isomerase-like protein
VHVAAFGGPSKAAAAEAVVRNFYAAWNAGDAGAAVAGMSDDVEYW